MCTNRKRGVRREIHALIQASKNLIEYRRQLFVDIDAVGEHLEQLSSSPAYQALLWLDGTIIRVYLRLWDIIRNRSVK